MCLAYSMKDIQKTGGMIIIMDKNKQDRLNKQMRFIEEIDKEKLIGRQTYLSDASRKENDAEHAWHMAIMAVLLKEYANEKIDVLKTMTMLLIHDIVENRCRRHICV